MIGVALKFHPGKDSAPVVVASGEGVLGELIKKIAKDNSVPIIKDPELANFLSKVPVGEEIPEKLYKAVVKIYLFIYKIEKDLRPSE
ncbi:MAG: EscU/YscU/HrcU family type III secretion system export apparatus switch protein [Leptospiraceae bacterium]|nr:EscU/YscU/HrcU family type III secretion system export apparatus switch protein [Leptospiraceae bacterium]